MDDNRDSEKKPLRMLRVVLKKGYLRLKPIHFAFRRIGKNEKAQNHDQKLPLSSSTLTGTTEEATEEKPVSACCCIPLPNGIHATCGLAFGAKAEALMSSGTLLSSGVGNTSAVLHQQNSEPFGSSSKRNNLNGYKRRKLGSHIDESGATFVR